MSPVHYKHSGVGPRHMAKILTVDPSTRKIEAMLKDAGLITIAIFDTPSVFVWPQVNEVWIVRRQNNMWMLDRRVDSNEEGQSINDLKAGHARINADTIKTISGNTVIAINDTNATEGQIISYKNNKWIAVDKSTLISGVNSISVTSPIINTGTSTSPIIAIDQTGLLINQSQVSGLTTALSGKAPTASPTFTGTVSAEDVSITGTLTATNTINGNISGSAATVTDSNVVRADAANTFTAGPQTINIDSATHKGIVIKGTTSQTGNLQEWQDSSGNLLANISSSGVLDMGAHNITSLSDPRTGQPQDAATKNYVDLSVAALSANRKDAVRLATNGLETSYTISGGAVTTIVSGAGKIDNHAAVTNDRILVKDAPTSTGSPSLNSNSPANGIYIVTSTSGTTINVSRANDMDVDSEVYNAYTFVKDGSDNIGTSWGIFKFGTLGNGVLNTDNIQWVQTGASVVYLPGSGITITGTTINVGGTIANSTVWNGSTIQPAYGGTGITSLGTGVATALGINVGLTGSFITDSSAATLSNKTISGSSNTITSIGNSSLTNSTISGVALGGTLANLSIGTDGLKTTSGTSPYTGASAVAIDIDSTKVATLSATDTLTSGITKSSLIKIGLTPASSGFVKTDTSGNLTTDSNTYLTSNQAITLTGNVTGGPGTTSISTTIANNVVTSAMLNTALSPGGNVSTNLVTVGGTQTLTSKTLTSPKISGSGSGVHNIVSTNSSINDYDITLPLATGTVAIYNASTGALASAVTSSSLTKIADLGDAGFVKIDTNGNLSTTGSLTITTSDISNNSIPVEKLQGTSGTGNVTINNIGAATANYSFGSYTVTSTGAITGGSLATTSNGNITANGSGNISTTSGNITTSTGTITSGGGSITVGTSSTYDGSVVFKSQSSTYKATLKLISAPASDITIRLPASSADLVTTAVNLGAFANTTAAQLASVMYSGATSESTGTATPGGASYKLVFSNSPSITTPTFTSAGIIFNNPVSGTTTLNPNSSPTGSPTVSLPSASGTLALTSDISSSTPAYAYTTTNATLGSSDNTIVVGGSTSGLIITLPSAATVLGRVYNIKNINSNPITVNVAASPGTDYIDGQSGVTSYTIGAQYQTLTLQSISTGGGSPTYMWVIL